MVFGIVYKNVFKFKLIFFFHVSLHLCKIASFKIQGVKRDKAMEVLEVMDRLGNLYVPCFFFKRLVQYWNC